MSGVFLKWFLCQKYEEILLQYLPWEPDWAPGVKLTKVWETPVTGLVTLRLVHTQPPGLCELQSQGSSLSTGSHEVATCESLLPETVAPILGAAVCPMSLPPLGISEELLVFQSARVEWWLPSSLHAEPETDLLLVWKLVTALLNTVFCKNKNMCPLT